MFTNKIARSQQTTSIAVEALHESPIHVANPNPVRLNLTGSVFVDYDLTIVDELGVEQNLEIRVQFPDEVRALLETITWRRGIRMTEKLSDIGTAYVLRLFADGNLGRPSRVTAESYPHVASSQMLIVHPSLEYVRASLVTLPTPV